MIPYTVSQDMFLGNVLQIHVGQQMIGTITISEKQGFVAQSKIVQAKRPFAEKQKAIDFLIRCIGRQQAPKPDNDTQFNLF